jgi:hypothetical protein
MSRLPHFLGNRLTDGDEAVSLTHRPAALYPPEDSWYPVLLEAVYPRVIVQLVVLLQLKNPMTSSGIEPATFRLVAIAHSINIHRSLKGRIFADLPDIQHSVTTLLRGIPENDFQDSFRQWHHHLTKCIASQGEHPLVHM